MSFDTSQVVFPDESSKAAAAELRSAIARLSAAEDLAMRLGGPADGPGIEIPEAMRPLLDTILAGFAAGHGILMKAVPAEVSVSQMAAILGVAPHVALALLEENAIPSNGEGQQRLARTEAVLRYREGRRTQGSVTAAVATSEGQHSGRGIGPSSPD